MIRAQRRARTAMAVSKSAPLERAASKGRWRKRASASMQVFQRNGSTSPKGVVS